MVLKTVLALGVKRARKGKICGEVEGHGTRAGTRCRQRTILDPAGRPGGARPLAAVSPTARLELGRAEAGGAAAVQRARAGTRGWRSQCEQTRTDAVEKIL